MVMAKKPKKPKLSFPVCWYNSKVFKLVQGAVAFSIASSARSCFHINLEQFNGAAVFKCNHEFSSTYSWAVFNPAMHCTTNTSAPLNFTVFLHSLFSEYYPLPIADLVQTLPCPLAHIWRSLGHVCYYCWVAAGTGWDPQGLPMSSVQHTPNCNTPDSTARQESIVLGSTLGPGQESCPLDLEYIHADNYGEICTESSLACLGTGILASSL